MMAVRKLFQLSGRLNDGMYIVSMTFTAKLESIEPYLPARRAWQAASFIGSHLFK